MQLILGNVSIFKSTSVPVAALFTETACIWNVAVLEVHGLLVNHLATYQ
jgi:hypothetical protein